MRWLITIALIVIGGIMVLACIACIGFYVIIKAWENIFNDQSRGQ